MAINKYSKKNNQSLRDKSNSATISLFETDSEALIPYTYDNDSHCAFVKRLMKEGQKTSFDKIRLVPGRAG